ncbi:hypothetical protein LCGC14_0590840 [marine sediment metagenome]|uniref:SprT-like domain-containing protein n=1 Tax=marine sediment metagenome TaxID=412755 RepID=A0A0F9RDI0_9ZZZZ|nr:hypothetical protein [archaeon]
MDLKELKKIMPEIFEKVKKDVKGVYGRHRAGLSLGLVEMGMYRGGFIGGMHFYPGTDIVMNKTPLKIILNEQPFEIVWAYIYHILLHEYVHSLGIINEQQCRIITLKISEETFMDSDHPAIILAKNGIGTYFQNLNLIYSPPDLKPDGIPIEYIYEFDRKSYDYYS